MLNILSIWPSTVEGWVGLIVLICTAIGAIVGLVPTVLKLRTALKEIAKNKDYAKLIKIAKKAMAAAQASGQSGPEKKEMVLAAIKAGAAEAGVVIDDEAVNKLCDSIDDLKNFFNEMKKADEASKNS